MSPTTRSLRSVIGSKWLVYLPAYAWLIPLWVMSSTLSSPLTGGGWHTFVIVLINVLAIGLVAGVFFVLRATVWNPNRRTGQSGINPLIVISGGFLLGAVKGTSTVLLTELVLHESSESGLARVLSGGMLGIVTVACVSALFSQLETYRRERDVLIADIIQQEITASSSRSADETPELKRFIEESLGDLLSSPVDPDALADTVDAIRERRVRPMSHQIWERENQRIPNFHLSTFVGICLSRLRFAILPVAIVFFVVSFPAFIPGLGVQRALLVVSVQLVVLTGALIILRLLRIHSVVLGTTIFLAVTSVLAVALTAATVALANDSLPLPVGQLGVLLWLLIVTATLAASVWRDVAHSRDVVRGELTRADPTVGLSDLARSQAALSNRALARLLHADVQNELLARSLAIRSLPANHPSGQELEKMVSQHRAALVNYLSGLVVAPATISASQPLAEFVSSLTNSWQGIAHIDVERMDEIGDHTALVSALKDALAEAVTNAVKHGLARTITLSLEHTGSRIVVTINDDGLGPREGLAGLGSFLFSSIPHSTWTLEPSATGTGSTLRLEIEP